MNRYILFSYGPYRYETVESSIVGVYETLSEAKEQANKELDKSCGRIVEIYDFINHHLEFKCFTWNNLNTSP